MSHHVCLDYLSSARTYFPNFILIIICLLCIPPLFHTSTSSLLISPRRPSMKYYCIVAPLAHAHNATMPSFMDLPNEIHEMIFDLAIPESITVADSPQGKHVDSNQTAELGQPLRWSPRSVLDLNLINKSTAQITRPLISKATRLHITRWARVDPKSNRRHREVLWGPLVLHQLPPWVTSQIKTVTIGC